MRCRRVRHLADQCLRQPTRIHLALESMSREYILSQREKRGVFAEWSDTITYWRVRHQTTAGVDRCIWDRGMAPLTAYCDGFQPGCAGCVSHFVMLDESIHHDQSTDGRVVVGP